MKPIVLCLSAVALGLLAQGRLHAQPVGAESIPKALLTEPSTVSEGARAQESVAQSSQSGVELPLEPEPAVPQQPTEPAPTDATPTPRATAESGQLAAVQSELARQRQELQALREQMPVRPAAPVWSVQFSGYIQVDWVVHNQASQNEIDYSSHLPLNQDRFTLRRGHLRAEASREWFGAALEIDANTTNGSQLRPVNAEVLARWPAKPHDKWPMLTATVGLIRIPFGFEVQERDQVRPFLERAQALRALFPGEFDLGAKLAARYGFVDVSLAAMNGHPIGDKVFPALAPTKSKELIGHVSVDVEVVPRVRFGLGASIDEGRGFRPGTPTTKDQLVWRDDNGDGIVQSTEVQVAAGVAATASAQFHRFALGADARLAIDWSPLGEFMIRSELVRASNLDRGLEVADPIGAGYDLREWGWYLGFTQQVTPYAMLGIRYDRYNPDADRTNPLAAARVPIDRTYSTTAFLGMLRYDNARLVVEFDKNHNALGRAPNGSPATLKCDSLIVRGQVVF